LTFSAVSGSSNVTNPYPFDLLEFLSTIILQSVTVPKDEKKSFKFSSFACWDFPTDSPYKNGSITHYE